MEDRKQVEKIVSMIKEYDKKDINKKRISEEQKEQALETFIKAIKICSSIGVNPIKLLKECCIKNGFSIPKKIEFFEVISLKEMREIKKGDTLIFNMANTELEDKGIYFFYFEFDGHQFEDWGIYNKNSNIIETDRLQFDIEDIIILGKLFQIEREL